MSFATSALRLTFETLHRTGASRLASQWTQGLGVIFCLHRVQAEGTANAGFQPNSNLFSTPQFLDAALTLLAQSGYEFLSLDDAALRISAGTPGIRPFAVFTLDDGYRDNLEQAMPVFVKHACPFTVYVTPGFVDGTTEMWWMALEAMIARGAGRELAVGADRMTIGSSDADKWTAWKRFAPIVQGLPEHEQRTWTREAAAYFGVDLKQMCFDAIMSWDEVREMASHPLATIGAHTLNHFAVSRLSEAEARSEIVQSGLRLTKELGKPTRNFAFPYGNAAHAGPRDFDLCRQAGYMTAVTTRLGTVFPEHRNHLHALPRVMVSGKYQQARWLKVLAQGLPGFLKNKGRRLNVA